jgi:hypothetical protein
MLFRHLQVLSTSSIKPPLASLSLFESKRMEMETVQQNRPLFLWKKHIVRVHSILPMVIITTSLDTFPK